MRHSKMRVIVGVNICTGMDLLRSIGRIAQQTMTDGFTAKLNTPTKVNESDEWLVRFEEVVQSFWRLQRRNRHRHHDVIETYIIMSKSILIDPGEPLRQVQQ